MDRAAEWSFVHELTKPLYAQKMGRPSLDPVVFFKCMLIGFYENIIHDTELEYRIADSLSLRKFLGYCLEERTPDESTLRKTRQRMPEDAFNRVFAYVRELCGNHALVKGRAVGTDSTAIDADTPATRRSSLWLLQDVRRLTTVCWTRTCVPNKENIDCRSRLEPASSCEEDDAQ